MDKIILDFTYEKEEYIKGYQKYLVASKKIRKTDIPLVLILVPLLGVYMVKSGMRPILIIAFAIALLAAAAGCFLYFYTPVKIYRQTEKLKDHYHLEFSPSGIHFQTSTVKSNLAWSTYKEVWESDSFYFLIQAAYQFSLIPKRAVGEEQSAEFSRLLADKFPVVKKV